MLAVITHRLHGSQAPAGALPVNPKRVDDRSPTDERWLPGATREETLHINSPGGELSIFKQCEFSKVTT